ncbi:hypothetical protein MicvaDRAFT_3191 [Microcoleus vaginatus FGP-2]|nr:hypothetical protein MicvaDRAFT_3191 [Microcoleus vaginatus FGP-2]
MLGISLLLAIASLLNDSVIFYAFPTRSLRITKQFYGAIHEAIAITFIPYQGLPIIVKPDQ